MLGEHDDSFMDRALMQEAVTTPTLSAAEFFTRVRERLDLVTPAGLTDPSVTPKRGDHDIDPVMEKIAMVALSSEASTRILALTGLRASSSSSRAPALSTLLSISISHRTR